VAKKKINITRRQPPQYWKVEISVDDPKCSFSINSQILYMKVFKANNLNAAVREAATYCNKYMKYYPGTAFSYSTKNVQPYSYVNYESVTKAEL
jgi:hypothetical protein